MSTNNPPLRPPSVGGVNSMPLMPPEGATATGHPHPASNSLYGRPSIPYFAGSQQANGPGPNMNQFPIRPPMQGQMPSSVHQDADGGIKNMNMQGLLAKNNFQGLPVSGHNQPLYNGVKSTSPQVGGPFPAMQQGLAPGSQVHPHRPIGPMVGSHPPLPGQSYQKPGVGLPPQAGFSQQGMMPPIPNSLQLQRQLPPDAQMQMSAPMRFPQPRVMPPTGVRPPHMLNSQGSNLSSRQAFGPSCATMPQKAVTQQSAFSGAPNELPLPFGGQPQQLNTHSGGLTPSPGSSAPQSQRSSRDPSPVPGTQYDAMEGQFSPQSAPSTPQSAPSTPQSEQPGQGPARGGISGRRQYPQMPGQYSGGFPQAPSLQPKIPPSNMSAQQLTSQPGSMQYPTSTGYQPQTAGAMPPSQGFQSPPVSQPGYQPQTAGAMPPSQGFQSPPVSQPGYQPQTAGAMPPTQSFQSPPVSQPGYQYQQSGYLPPAPSTTSSGFQQSPQMYANNTSGLNSSFNKMSFQHGDHRPVNLLQDRHVLPPDGVKPSKPPLPHDFKKVNCSPDIFRCTLSAIPQTQQILNKARLPLGILIHPFKDLSTSENDYCTVDCDTFWKKSGIRFLSQCGENGEQLPVIQSSVIVRCRSCRTYINPFATFADQRRWKCNLCFRVNDLPDEFQFDPVSKTYGDPQRRPEIKSATIEFIAPSEYMLRPPQPAVYLFVLDVSYNAIQTGYLEAFCQTMVDNFERLPGDTRTQIGFITYDKAIHFYNLAEGLSQPQMLTVCDIEDVFLPCPDNLLVNLHEAKDLVLDLLNNLPIIFRDNYETGNALGAALQVAHKLLGSTGGRVTVMNTCLPNAGPGALKCREDPNERSGKEVPNMAPATDFYKKMALDCSGQQVAVDVFMLNSQYSDLASIACVSKFSGGTVYYYPGYSASKNPGLIQRFSTEFKRYLTRKIGFESVMRIRCTRGMSIHTFHGNFFVRSTDLLSLPNINPDSGFGMQMSIEDPLTDTNTACFQAALLYTSSKGERRIRVHTLCLPITTQVSEVISNADQQAIIGLLSKMAVDRSLSAGLGAAREAMINAAMDAVGAFMSTLPAGQRVGLLGLPQNLALMPLYILSLLKSVAFRIGTSTKLDERVFAMEMCKSYPLNQLMLTIHPNLYPVHALDDKDAVKTSDVLIPQPPLLQLSSAHTDRHGAYLMDTGHKLMLWVGGAISDRYCEEVFGVPNFMSIQDSLDKLPELDNPTSERLRRFLLHLQDQRPFKPEFQVIREDSQARMNFIQYMVEDRTESAMSYYEFIQHIQKQVKT